MVLPIVGMGGLGKTTFAQIIYNDPDIKKHFQLRKWVCVMDDFDVTDIANKISMSTEKDCESALEKLQQEVSGRRYLLVLDDVWNRDADKWAKLKYCLQQCGGSGSAILMTTRDERVAQIMGTAQTHQLVKMDKSDLLAIFEKRAFGSEEQKPDELVQIGKEIVDRCCGSPLAAKALGSVLSTWKSVEEWGAVLKKSSICDEESGILPILKLSYDDLPAYMKQCFAFCALFPKNYEINVEKLIQLWMANYFIPSEDAIRPETKGKQIFNELASRSFFQDVNRVPVEEGGSGSKYMTVCTVHDLMHDVALSVMGKECATIDERPNYVEILPYTVRHLFLSSYGPGNFLGVSPKKKCPGIQTLLGSINTTSSVRHLSKCTSLRALQLCYNRVSGLPFGPKHLKHLRYLDLSGNSHIKALPEEICIMYNLQTLNLSGCERLGELPKDMKYMTGLRHLYTDGCLSLKCMPPNLGQLTSLQTLTYFVVGCSSGCSGIGELRHLNLRGQLQLCHLENVTEADITIGNHGDKKDLIELSFAWKNDGSEVDFHEKVLDAFTPNRGLQVLYVDSYRSIRFPTWMTNLSVMQDLVKLRLVNCTMCDRLPQLWQLPTLQVLHLERLDRLQSLCIGNGDALISSTFPKLRELVLFQLKSLNGWWEVLEGRHRHQLLFPLLEELSIGSCTKLTNLPQQPTLGQFSSCGGNKALSAFPSLKKPMLHDLKSFSRWGAKEERHEEQTTFPQLENTNITDCPELSTLPEAPRLKALLFPDDRPLMWLSIARYMATLSNVRMKIAPSSSSQVQCSIQQVDDKGKCNHGASHAAMELRGSYFFNTSWKYFVNLEHLEIISCDELVYWPLKELQCLASLKRFTIHCCNNLTGSAKIPEVASARNLLLPRLEYLEIKSCSNVVDVLSLPPSLKELYIERCSKLESIWGKMGIENQSWYVEHQDELTLSESCSVLPASGNVQDPSVSARIHSLPCMESLTLISCQSLVELLSFPLYLKEVQIWSCPKLEYIWGKQDKKMKSQYVEQPTNLEILESPNELTASTTVQGSLPSTRNHLLPCLEYLRIAYCEGLLGILDLPSSLRKINISDCPKLEVLSGQFDKLGHLDIRFCDKLSLVESCKGDFSSLETLSIVSCESLKCLPNKPSHT